MKKLLIAGLLAIPVVALLAQTYKSRVPYPDEERKVAGVTEFIQDGPRYGILRLTPNPEQIVTNSVTNSIVVMLGTGALTNAFLQMHNPTNQGRYALTVVAKGNITVSLTTSNLFAANANGPGFNTMTNIVVNPYVVPTNSSALVINNVTNWLVVPGAE